MTESKKPRPSSLKQRVTTAVGLVAMLLVVLLARGWLAALVGGACVALAAYEEFRALSVKGYRPVSWPAFAVLIAAIPAILTAGSLGAVIVIAFAGCLAICLCVMRREKPELMGIVASTLPLLSVVLPGLCLIGLLSTQPEGMQVMLLVMVFTASVIGDTAAYFVGSNVGGQKLCPLISPNKTVSGAIGGLLGSVVFTVLAGIVVGWIFPDFTGFPPLWMNALVGLLAGAAAQVGDLFASMVKRHCGLKDFGHLFPGHGGMMDRMDSILFASIVIYCYRIVLLGVG